MKILMLTPYLPYPPFSGGQRRSWHLLRALGPKHQITLVALIKNPAEKKYLSELKPFCQSIFVFPRPPRPFTLKTILKTGFSYYPFLIVRNFSSQAKRALPQILSKTNFDLIHAETFYVMPHLPPTKLPILLVEQTIEYLVYQKFARRTKLWPAKPFLYLDVAKLRFWEQYYWRKASCLATVSEDDKKFIQKRVPEAKIEVVANGVDLEYFAKMKKQPQKTPTVLFVGQFQWLPNKEAVYFLVQKIWPLIREKLPTARLLVVGRHPDETIRRLHQPSLGIYIVGEVADIRRAYAKADVLLAPIFSGRGTKYKILEAMATKTPVVGTPLAVEGLGVTAGVQALVGKTAHQLAKATLTLLNNPQLAEKLADAAYRLVAKRFTWEKIANHLDQIYHSLARLNLE